MTQDLRPPGSGAKAAPRRSSLAMSAKSVAAAPGLEVAAWLRAHRIPAVIATPEASLAPWDVDLTGTT